MKLLIMADSGSALNEHSTSPQSHLEDLLNFSNQEFSQHEPLSFNLTDDPVLQLQLDSALNNLDITTLLDPAMPNTGGMEVMASIKRDLRHQIESLLMSQHT